MSNRPKPSAVIFARDIIPMAHFYTHVVGMIAVHTDQDHIVLDADGFQLVIHGIPAAIAASFDISVPPEIRTDTPLKICLPVDSIQQARRLAKSLGGKIKPRTSEWQARGFRACDGYDPEGNIFQVRENATTN